MQKVVLPSHKLRDHAYEQQNLFTLEEGNPSSKFVSHRTRMLRLFDSRKDSYSTKFHRRPQIFVKLGYRELCDSNLSDIRPKFMS